MYHGDLTPSDLMHWILHKKTEDSILSLTGPMLEKLVQKENHVAVVFLGDCDRNEESCEKVTKNVHWHLRRNG